MLPSGIEGRPALALDVPADPEVVEAVGKELELDPADGEERPVEKSGNPVEADAELC
ncbi:MAG: hypothetical protein KKD00_12045 [Gammaproteobacteria bacterium]|nr:hypothetical protein [Gammaproteobacteria bacterium]